MGRLFFASLFTLTILLSFVFFVIIAAFLYAGQINLGFAIGLTVTINVVLWLIGPAITDLMMSWFYQVRFISRGEAQEQLPEVAGLIDQVASQYHFPFPKIGIIPDKNPTAFTYGTARYNARIVLTEGIFEYLNADEARAVVAHELGHVVNRDFIVMMIGSTLVQILYEVYAVLIRVRGRASGVASLVALASFALYMLGIYFLYYLSRTREYLADEFSARTTSAKSLADALVKIAYGIVQTEASENAAVAADKDDKEARKEMGRSKRLLQSTRHLGITDAKNARHTALISYMGEHEPGTFLQVAAFDRVSPWARLLELGSTHPLTGNRLARLAQVARECGQSFTFDIDSVVRRLHVDKARLYGDFALGLLFYLLPALLGVVSFIFLPLSLLPAAFAVGILLQIPYRFPPGQPVATTVLEQMSDPYSSPFRGRPVAFLGKIIGRGVPGYVFGEDMMYQDPTGLTFLDYASGYGFVGDFFFGATKTRQLIGVRARAVGWFYRNISSLVSLRRLESEQQTITSHPMLWRVVLALFLIVLSMGLWEFWSYVPIPDFIRSIHP